MKGKRIGDTHWLLLVLAVISVTGCGTKGQNSLADSGGDLMAPDVARLEVVDDLGRPDVPPAGNDADSTKLDDIVDILPTEIPLHDVDTVEVPDVPLPDTDISDVDSNPFPDEPLLCGYQLKEGEYAYYNPEHKQEGLKNPSVTTGSADCVFYFPKRMWLLPDGKTLRLAVLWLNGVGVSIGDAGGAVLPQHAYSTYCWNPVKTVLPTGFVYWDVNTETQEVTFLSETVFASTDYIALLDGHPFDLVTGESPPGSFVKPPMKVPVGEDTYEFSPCPYESGQRCGQDSYPGTGGMDPEWEAHALMGAVDPPSKSVQLHFDIIFSRREIWSLRRFGPKREFKGVVPLPVSVHQLPKEKILRSGCACEQAVPAVTWSCSKDGPYICGLSKLVEPPHEYCRCSGGGKLEEMPPPEDQIERPYERVYFTPFEGENGLFTFFRRGPDFEWVQFSNVDWPQCQQDGTGTLDSWPALDAEDQMLWRTQYDYASCQFPEQCAGYVSSYTPSPDWPFWTYYLPCYMKNSNLCSGANTCIEKLGVDWSFQGLVSFRTSRQVFEPDSYPDATLFISMTGLDPRVPCDLEIRYSVPLWDW